MVDYKIVNASEQEEKFLQKVIKYITDNYADKLIVQKLKKIEIVDELLGGSSGRTIRDKIILPRKNGIDKIDNLCQDGLDIDGNMILKDLVSTIYHELWHVSTWDKYELLYEYVLNEKN